MRLVLAALLIPLFVMPLSAQEGPLPLPDDPPGYPGEPPPSKKPLRYVVGSGEAGRFGSKRLRFLPQYGLKRFLKLSIIGVSGSLNVKGIWVTYQDGGNNNEIRSLRGSLSAGKTRNAALGGRPVLSMEAEVEADDFWKKPGSFRIEAESLP